MSYKYPRLFSFAIDPSISVQNTMQAADLASLFNLPLSEQALDELISLQMDIQDVNYDPVAQDSWSFIWGHSNYSSRQFYKLGFMHLRKSPTFTWIWKSKCTPRLKFFAWLILMDRLNTKAIELHAPTSSAQKLKLMGRGEQFTYIPTLPLTWRLPQASDVE